VQRMGCIVIAVIALFQNFRLAAHALAKI
jgi:hypothetical protein